MPNWEILVETTSEFIVHKQKSPGKWSSKEQSDPTFQIVNYEATDEEMELLLENEIEVFELEPDVWDERIVGPKYAWDNGLEDFVEVDYE